MTDRTAPSRRPEIPENIRADFPTASHLLSLRLATTADLPLAAIRTGAPSLLRLGHELAAALPDAAPQLGRELARDDAGRLATIISRALTGHMMRKNQYLPLPLGWDHSVENTYMLFLQEFAAGGSDLRRLEAALATHLSRLRRLLAAREDGAERDDEPVCATYSPALQLRILGLDPHRLAGPILDLGCGESGALVYHLRSLGRMDVWGLDARCETSGALVRGSWLSETLSPKSFGTIIAHQSFSLHLLRAHLGQSQSDAARHVQAYMRILRALIPGGGFYYAPALPFLEDLLPSAYWSVRRWRLEIPFAAGGAFHAAHVAALPAPDHAA